MGWVGLGWVGLGWVGLGWVGLGWVGLGWVRLGSVVKKRGKQQDNETCCYVIVFEELYIQLFVTFSAC
ncbi:hypothetical protein J2Z83_002290 [Virgibacillus natechei]|uniref:Uncharacterized protein n=1 Tax=Virgibacillus natechei TaxID=1216297 RepID=A0ABS4IGT6_9BACI|nr:hypothetical protein [Virgibacillus natechei]MBP1970172.1 hypothetical protein [Virgibacillus natechei]UZD12875.1 hypothetical protein OLD84_18640 [Virgibacillus natechei]